MGIFGAALRGYGMLKKAKKASKTISSVKPNVPKTKLCTIRMYYMWKN